MASQAVLCLVWSETPEDTFCRAVGHLDRVTRIWYLSPMRAAKVQASLRIRAVSPEPPLLAHTSSESRGTFRQKARSLAPLNGWACAVKIYHDGMLEDTNSLDGAHFVHSHGDCFDIDVHCVSFSTSIPNHWTIREKRPNLIILKLLYLFLVYLNLYT